MRRPRQSRGASDAPFDKKGNTMLKNIALLILFILVGIVPASAQTVRTADKDSVLCAPALPQDVRLEQYPHTAGPLTVSQMADLGLSPKRLEFSTTMLNFYRDGKACGGGRWVLETVPAGTLVMVGRDGYVAYLGKCWNRLAPQSIIQVVQSESQPNQPQWYVRSLWKTLGEFIAWPFIGYK